MRRAVVVALVALMFLAGVWCQEEVAGEEADAYAGEYEEFFRDVEQGNMRRVKYHIEEMEIDVDEVTTSSGDAALHIAVQHQQKEVVEYLLQEELADVDLQNDNGRTPLHYAVLNGDSAMVYVLLKYNPDLDLASADGGSPLLVAAIEGHRDIVQLLKQFRIREHMESNPGAVDARKAAQNVGNVRVVKDEL